jgi:hypothetical protein
LSGLILGLVTYAVLYGVCVAIARALARRVVWSGGVLRIRFRAWMPRLIGVHGVAVFGVIWIAADRASQALIAHEWRHIEQERALGFLGYLPVYFMRFALTGSYERHPMEVDARAFARERWPDFPAVEAPAANRQPGRHP